MTSRDELTSRDKGSLFSETAVVLGVVLAFVLNAATTSTRSMSEEANAGKKAELGDKKNKDFDIGSRTLVRKRNNRSLIAC